MTWVSFNRRKKQRESEDRSSCGEQSAHCLRGITSFENSPPEGCSRNSSNMFAKLSRQRTSRFSLEVLCFVLGAQGSRRASRVSVRGFAEVKRASLRVRLASVLES